MSSRNKKGYHRINRKKDMDYVNRNESIKYKIQPRYKGIELKEVLMKKTKEELYNKLRTLHANYIRLQNSHIKMKLEVAYLERRLKRNI